MSDKKVWTVLPSNADEERKKREEEEYWASLAGPVTVRYINKDGASNG